MSTHDVRNRSRNNQPGAHNATPLCADSGMAHDLKSEPPGCTQDMDATDDAPFPPIVPGVPPNVVALVWAWLDLYFDPGTWFAIDMVFTAGGHLAARIEFPAPGEFDHVFTDIPAENW